MLNEKLMNLLNGIQKEIFGTGLASQLVYATGADGLSFSCRSSCSGDCVGSCEGSCSGSCDDSCDGSCEYGGYNQLS